MATATPRQMIVDWDANPTPEAPTAPDSLRESGLTPAFIADMILRTIYARGPMIGRDLAQYLCLPFKVIKDSLRWLKDEKLLQIDGGAIEPIVHETGERKRRRRENGITRPPLDQVLQEAKHLITRNRH